MDDTQTLGERIVTTRFEPDRNAAMALAAAFARLGDRNGLIAVSDASEQPRQQPSSNTKEVML